jgi:hypothetical protein
LLYDKNKGWILEEVPKKRLFEDARIAGDVKTHSFIRVRSPDLKRIQ